MFGRAFLELLSEDSMNPALLSMNSAPAVPAADADAGKQSGNGDAAADSAPIWEDPDDTGLRVDVATKNRLRKLRLREKQTTMDGAGYG